LDVNLDSVPLLNWDSPRTGSCENDIQGVHGRKQLHFTQDAEALYERLRRKA